MRNPMKAQSLVLYFAWNMEYVCSSYNLCVLVWKVTEDAMPVCSYSPHPLTGKSEFMQIFLFYTELSLLQ